MRWRSLTPHPPARAPAILFGAAPGAARRIVARVGTARAVPLPHAASEHASEDPDSVLLPGRTRRGARTTGVPPLLSSHAPRSAAAQEISTDELPQRILLGLRAPMRATTTLANTERVVTRRDAGDGTMLVVVPADSVLWYP
jgi:hypothetical protein